MVSHSPVQAGDQADARLRGLELNDEQLRAGKGGGWGGRGRRSGERGVSAGWGRVDVALSQTAPPVTW